MMRQSAEMIQQTLVLWVHIAHTLGQPGLRRKDVNVNTAIKLIPPSKTEFQFIYGITLGSVNTFVRNKYC